MTLDVNDFKRRAERYAKRHNKSLATLSKQLFSTARTLPGMIHDEVSPRFVTLENAEAKLTELELADEQSSKAA